VSIDWVKFNDFAPQLWPDQLKVASPTPVATSVLQLGREHAKSWRGGLVNCQAKWGEGEGLLCSGLGVGYRVGSTYMQFSSHLKAERL